MKLDNIKEITLFEHHFWLQILGDHSRFIFNALSPLETAYIREADKFIEIFDNLLEKSYKADSDEEIAELNSEAYSAAMKIREFKLSIITKQIKDKIKIGLPPTFINHMVNELEEYLCIIDSLKIGKIPASYDIHLHLLWLPDGVGHALSVSSSLDMTEKELIKKSKAYSKIFTDLYLRTIEFKGYTRTGIYDFEALRKHNDDADESMTSFKEFLKYLKESILNKKTLGTLSPMMADHMYREESYYLTKLSMASHKKKLEGKSRFL